VSVAAAGVRRVGLQESFDKFGATLMPILQEVGLDAGQPMVEPLHNMIT